MVNQSILKILLIIDYANYCRRHTFQHATANNVQYVSDRKPFDHKMGGVSCIN